MRKLLIIIYALILAVACRKENNAAAGTGVRLSQLAVDFDTLFTTTGSVTEVFKIFNDNPYPVRVDLRLQQGSASSFAFNADGRKGPEVNDMEVYAKDSAYVFLSVKIDASSDQLPFIVSDTLSVTTNNSVTNVALTASGQNANFLRSHVIQSDTTWTGSLPIVILGGVLVAENTTLTIEEGTNIYLHADAPLIVDGTLKVLGKSFDSTRVRFTGDRLDDYYRDLPASWPGIYFTTKSRDNVLEYAEIRNAYQGIVAESSTAGAAPNVELRQCVIDNCYDAGIIGVNTSIDAKNCLISNCGKNVLLAPGGKYSFTHCTIASIGNIYIPHKQPVLTVADFARRDDQLFFGNMDVRFTNCIIWGSNGGVEDEAVVIREGTQPFASTFVNCLWRVETRPVHSEVTSVIENTDPMFLNATGTGVKYDFRLKDGSPAINKGASTDVTIDLDGKVRTGTADIGAYESTF